MVSATIQMRVCSPTACLGDVRVHSQRCLSSALLGRKVVSRNGSGDWDRRRKHDSRSRMQLATGVQTSASTSSGEQLYELPEYMEGELDRPRWAGNDPLSKFVNLLISFKPLFDLMKPMARNVLIRTAEKNGIPWQKMSADILSSKEVYVEKELLEDKALVYPDYYLKEFHAYDNGNLSWLAASEVEQATMSMACRAIKSATSVEEAVDGLRGGWFKAIKNHHVQHGGSEVLRVLDVGCATGNSTRYLAGKFPDAEVTGLDLSPYFVAVAQYLDKQTVAKDGCGRKPIRWMHAKGEDTGLPSASFDLVSLAFVLHECSPDPTRDLLKEALRLLRPGGTVAITDNSPKSKIIQDLPPVLFTLMKSTEPWADEYYAFDLEEAMRETGFLNVQSRLTDPRHRTVTGTAPA